MFIAFVFMSSIILIGSFEAESFLRWQLSNLYLRRQLSPWRQRRAVLGDGGVDFAGVEENLGGGLLSLPFDQLSHCMGGSGKAKLIWQALRAGEDPLQAPTPDDTTSAGEQTVLSLKARQRLTELLGGAPLLQASVAQETVSACGTRKLLLSLARDQQQVESVLIPSSKYDRTTLCVSTQVGCDRGCAFCLTGKMGLIRNLHSDEILAQLVHARGVAEQRGMPPLTNVVFMGMGDAGRNVPAVSAAVRAMTDRQRFAMAESKITVSTVGPAPAVFQQLAQLPALIAWSLHSPDDAVRKALVPSTQHSTLQLRDGFIQALQSRPNERKRTAMIAITLIAGINDSPADAQMVADFCRPMLEVIPKLALDLIPYNDINVSGFQRPSRERVIAFQRHLREQGFFCSVRLTRGDDESAACGMLATQRAKRSNTSAAPAAL